MVKKKVIDSTKVKTPTKIKIKNILSQISPLKFLKNNNFIYIIKYYKLFKKFVNSYDIYKITDDELFFLEQNINNIKNSFNLLNTKIDNNYVSNYFQKLFPYIKKITPTENKETRIIKEIMINRKKNENISLLKIKEILKEKYKLILSKSSIYRILKNKLNYRFRKTVVKNKELNELKYVIISFIFIKIIIRAMELNFNFIYIDETNFCLENNHYKTWRTKDDNINFACKTKKKINMILAVSINNIIYYEMVKDNINKDIFKNFLINTLAKMEQKDINNSVFILDNCSVH